MTSFAQRQKIKSHKSSKWWRSYTLSPFLIINCTLALFLCIFITLFGVNNAENTTMPETVSKNSEDANTHHVWWREGRTGDGTEHEQLNDPHFHPVKYTEFSGYGNYTTAPSYSSIGMSPVFNITRTFMDNLITEDTQMPDGYIILNKDNAMTFDVGPKVRNNEWADLLTKYWEVLLFISLWVIVIAIIPFIGLCYCCICCCRRCGKSCPPCDEKSDGRRRCCFGFLLLLLIIGLLFGIIIALVTNKLLERGFEEASGEIRRGTKDACTFLKVTSDHIGHLFVNNFQDLETQLTTELNNAHRHIFLDLSDVSQANALEKLKRILENMPAALKIMENVDKLEKDIRYYALQLKDAMRGVKRDINWITSHLCTTRECESFVISNDINILDLGCLQYETVPNTTLFVEGMKRIIDSNILQKVNEADKRLNEISVKVKLHMKYVAPPILKDIRGGGEFMKQQADSIKTLVDSFVKHINQETVLTANAQDDAYVKLEPHRYLVNLVLISVLLLILFCLIVALCCGCCGKRPRGYRDDCCNKSTGASCLMLSMIFIFLTFSIMATVGLAYFILGMTTYHVICIPLRDKQSSSLFNKVDNEIYLNHMFPKFLHERLQANPLPPIRLSSAIAACHENQSLYDVFKLNSLYNLRELKHFEILKNINRNTTDKVPATSEDLSSIIILTEEDEAQINSIMRNGNLSSYHSNSYKAICKPFIPRALPQLAQALDDLGFEINHQSQYPASIGYRNQATHVRAYQENLYKPLEERVDLLLAEIKKVDSLILYKNYNFSNSIEVLLEMIESSEKFIRVRGKNYITEITANLTAYVNKEVDRYMDMIVEQTQTGVGRCAPLAKVYDESVNFVCHRLADPINGFWFGVMICVTLFLPILYVGNKLQKLYNKRGPYEAPIMGPEYLYDAYTEREHVPLSNGPKKRRKGYDRRHERERELDYYDDSSPGVSTHVGGTGMRDSRYNDMAPKHWDSEPPRYQNPPMAPPASEYERPPPYYYAGAAEQD